MSNPYKELSAHAFWRTAVAERGAFGLENLWQPKYQIVKSDKIVTAGSCFAQHIGRALKARGYHWFDAEPAPKWLIGEAASELNYGIFSFRTGNIYTPKMLRQWVELAFGEGELGEVWCANGRWYDPLRPVIEPNGFASRDELEEARAATLASIRRAVIKGNAFVFTLGLTESWRNRETGSEYALCPGTVAGAEFDANQHVFHNAGFSELKDDLDAALSIVWAQNPELRILLTVSPVPLVASASGAHVLTATSHSKSMLRAVASEVTVGAGQVDYFPSYEIITHSVFRGMFFAPNMRSVVPQGVETVMGHFFADQERMFGAPPNPAPLKGKKRQPARRSEAGKSSDVKCEEELLDAFSK